VLRNGGPQFEGQKRPRKARERRREWLTTIMTAMQEKAKEGRRDGRGGTRVGAACNTQKSGGEGAPIDIGTEGVRGSNERGDRRAEERQKRVQTDGEWERGDRGQRRPRQNGQEGEMCSVGKEAKDLRRLPSPPYTYRVANCVLCVWRGRRVVVPVMANLLLRIREAD
jgi:hypothetical protein